MAFYGDGPAPSLEDRKVRKRWTKAEPVLQELQGRQTEGPRRASNDRVDRQPRHLTPAFAVSVVVHASFIVALLFLFSHAREQKPATVTRLDPVNSSGFPIRGRPVAAVAERPEADAASARTDPAVSRPGTTEAGGRRGAANDRTRARTQTDRGARPRQPWPQRIQREQTAGLGDKTGTGIGDRPGPGSGDGTSGIGNGVSAPIPLRRPPPAYTAEAMRARLQGIVVLNCVVRPDGKCSDIRVTKSLDMMFGLDQQAIASAREWVFRPGMRMGRTRARSRHARDRIHDPLASRSRLPDPIPIPIPDPTLSLQNPEVPVPVEVDRLRRERTLHDGSHS